VEYQGRRDEAAQAITLQDVAKLVTSNAMKLLATLHKPVLAPVFGGSWLVAVSLPRKQVHNRPCRPRRPDAGRPQRAPARRLLFRVLRCPVGSNM